MLGGSFRVNQRGPCSHVGSRLLLVRFCRSVVIAPESRYHRRYGQAGADEPGFPGLYIKIQQAVGAPMRFDHNS